MFTSEFNERSRSNPLCDFRLGTVATSDHENGLADGTREWTVRGLGCETSVSEPCVSVLRGSQRRYHGIIGVAVDDIAGGGDEVWEQAISKLKKRFTFWHWEVGKGVCPYQESDFVPLGKMSQEQSGAMRSVLGALGYLVRESRPDLSGACLVLQSRFNRAQVSDIQETNRVVRLAKAHTDLALLVCKIPVDQVCFVSYGDASGGSTRAEQAQARYVILFADMTLLAGLAAPVTLISWRFVVSNGWQPVPLQRRTWACLRRLHKVIWYVRCGAKTCW